MSAWAVISVILLVAAIALAVGFGLRMRRALESFVIEGIRTNIPLHQRVLAEEDDPERLATSIPRIVDTVVRAVRAQRALSGVMAEHLTEALTQVLIELGLGEE